MCLAKPSARRLLDTRITGHVLKQAFSDRDPAIANRDPAIADRDPAFADRDPVIADRDPAFADHDPSFARAELTTPEPPCGAASWHRPHPAPWGAVPAQVCVRGDAAEGACDRGSLGLWGRVTPELWILLRGRQQTGTPRPGRRGAEFGWPAPAASRPGHTVGTPVRAWDLRLFPELRDPAQRPEASGREEGWAPRAGVASGPPAGAESRRSRYLPGVP